MQTLPAYAELHCRSNFSFLTGASHPQELVERAAELGYAALAITDECSVAGVVRAHLAAEDVGLHLVIGAEMRLVHPGPQQAPHARLVVLAQTRRGYGNLSHWITLARRRAEKGSYLAHPADVEGKEPTAPTLAGLPDCLALLVPEASQSFEEVFAQAMWLKCWFGDRAGLAVRMLCRADDETLADTIVRVAGLAELPVVATGDVLMHLRSRKPLQDTLTATRLKRPVAECGVALAGNAEQHLRPRTRLAGLFEPEWLHNSVVFAARCSFRLSELKYEYPREIVPEGETPTSHLRTLAYAGLAKRFPDGRGERLKPQIEKELALIRQLEYEAYFLTVADVVAWARGQGILCQGRGSAANSVVCYCLEVTEVNPEDATLLFERFISVERNEPPDIDIDFEHQRREEVIQYIYAKYGRHRAALTAIVNCYRPRSALRDVGRALGFDLQRIEAVCKTMHWFDGRHITDERLRESGLDPSAPITRLWVELAQQLIGFPRHLSQHPGGFVIARDRLAELVPIENATMEKRSVVQWDKDDLDALRLIKVDILALGMLSAIRRSLEFIAEKLGRPFRLQDIPQGDETTYDMVCRADTVGVFQIESRAQMSMLPRLKPRCLYDLVIEVAIVRPGPIQGGMVHPYLERRGLPPDKVTYPSPALEEALGRTLGVPIFQEQVMQIAILAADFTPGEADGLRRAMAAWKRKGGLAPFHEKLVGRMVEKGYDPAFAESIFKQIQGFGEYGFPESHAAGFAQLAYFSSWIKRHHPDTFLAGLLNSQPMGFYAPAQLVRDAREHGVEVLPVDIHLSAAQSVPVPSAAAVAIAPALPRAGPSAAAGSPVGADAAAVSPVETGAAASSPIGAGAASASRAGAKAAASLPVEMAAASASPVGAKAASASPVGTNVAFASAIGTESVSASTVSTAPATTSDAMQAIAIPAPGPLTGLPLRPVRLGFDRVSGLSPEAAARIVEARGGGRFDSIEDLARRARLDARDLQALANADALKPLTGHRHQAAWTVAGVDTRPTALLRETRSPESPVVLEAPTEVDEVGADYRALGLTLHRHPLALLRERLAAFRIQPATVLRAYPDGRLARASGLVTHRQRPETAKGTMFVTIEDETGAVNVIVWPAVVEAQRKPLLAARLLTVYGRWQRTGEGDTAVMHIVAIKIVDHTELLHGLAATSRDFR